MEVITTVLFCTIGFLVYLVNANNNEVMRLKSFLREKEFETQNLLEGKENEISNLSRQLQAKKNKSLGRPRGFEIRSKFHEFENEIQNLKRQLSFAQNENEHLKKNISEKDNRIVVLNETLGKLRSESEKRIAVLNEMSKKLQSENEKFKTIILNLEHELKQKNSYSTNVDGNEIYILRNENYELKNRIQTLNKNLTSLKNENDDLKLKVKNFENGTLQGVNGGLPSSLPPKSKRFVQVTFKNFGNGKTYDYLLGNHRNIKVGDFVMVPTHGTIKPAKVVRISEQGEISEHANSEIIKKL